MKSDRVLRFLAVPFLTAPLLLIIVFSLLLTLARYATLLGIPLAFVLMSGLFKYSFVLLDHVAEGGQSPPVLSIEMLNPVDEHRTLLMLVLAIAVFFGSDAAASWFGPIFAIAIGLMTLLILPAVIAVQGATGSLVQSLNLRRCFRLIVRLGSDYVLILLCIALFWGMGATLAHFADAIPFIVRTAFLVYAWLASFTLIGGVLYERRDRIGWEDVSEPQSEELDQTANLRRLRDQHIDRIYAEWRGGAHSKAWQTITQHLAQSTDPLSELRWMYERTARWPDHRLAGRLAQELLPRLLAVRQHGEALHVVRERLAANPEFRLLASADLIRLAHLSRDAGDRPTARALLKDFLRFYPSDPAQKAVDQLTEQLQR